MSNRPTDTLTTLQQKYNLFVNNTNEFHILKVDDGELINNGDNGLDSISLKEINKAEQYPDSYPEEYEQWSNMGNDSNLSEELNTPCGIASNEYHTANPTTYDRGYEMYANNSIAPAAGVAPSPKFNHSFGSNTPKRLVELSKLGIETVTVSRDQLILSKYLPKDLIEKVIADSGKKAVILGAGLGLGKSTLMSSMMLNSKSGQGIAVSHRVKLIEQICDVFKAENYKPLKTSDGGLTPDRVGTTIHSLDGIHELELLSNAVNGEICAADEFESIANELNQYKTLKTPHKAIAALKSIAQKTKLFIAADAHPSSQSVHLLSVLGFDTSDILFINVERPELEGYSIQIVEQGESKDVTPFTAMVNEAKASLERGEKVTIVSMSREKLKQAHRELKTASLFPIMIHSRTSEETASSLTPESYQNHDLTMLSPSMSTGISFDGDDKYNHADHVMVHASNFAGTGGPFDCLQALFRDRKPKKITIYYESGDDPLDQADKMAAYAKHRFNTVEEILENDQALRENYTKNRPNDQVVSSFLLCNRIKNGNDKLDFIGILREELKYKGAVVTSTTTDGIAAGEVTPELMKAHKEEMRSEYIDSVASAIKLTDDVDESELDTELLKAATTRRYIENETCVDLDRLSNPDKVKLIESVIPEHGLSVLNLVWGIERAFSDQKKLKDIVKYSLGGAACFEGDKARFIEGDRNTKIYWQYTNKYVKLGLKALGIEGEAGNLTATVDSVVISNDTIRNRSNPAYSLASSLSKDSVSAIRSGLVGVMTTHQQIKKNPARYIIDILKNLFDVKARKSRGKTCWTVDVSSIERLISIVNARADSGVNSIGDYHQQIQEWIDSAPTRQSRVMQKEANTTKTISDAQSSIAEYMNQFGRPELMDQALEWMQPYENRINSGKIKHSDMGVLLLKFIALQPVDNFL